MGGWWLGGMISCSNSLSGREKWRDGQDRIVSTFIVSENNPSVVCWAACYKGIVLNLPTHLRDEDRGRKRISY